jgi:hypothetical protein
VIRAGATLTTFLLLAACGGGTKPVEDPTQAGRLQVEAQIDGPLPGSSFQHGSVLPVMTSRPFRVRDLPTLTSKNDAPPADRQRLVKELTVTRSGESGLVRFQGAEGRFARLTFDDSQSTTSSVRVQCGQWTAAHLGLHILDIHADGRATFTRIDGIFDGSACEAVERARVSFEPAVLVPGYLYAFRACSTSPCENGKERVTFLMPPLAGVESDAAGMQELPILSEPFGVASFEPVQGAASVLTAIVNEAALAQRFKTRPAWLKPGPVALGIDLGRTTEEPEPVGVASFGVVTQGPLPPAADAQVMFDH